MLKTLKYPVIGLASAVGLLAIWGFIEPRLLSTEMETATIPGLPAAWEGKQIGQISDFQVGLWGDNPGTARRGIAQLIEANPAAVFISGDFIYHAGPDNPEAEITLAVSIVEPLIEAGIPTYAVMGNHDYGMSSKKAPPKMDLAAQMAAALEAAGVDVLKNETVAMTLPDSEDPLLLVALGSRWANQADVDKAFDGVASERPRVVLMHNPDTYEELPANSAPLAVAGHTHGGQMRVPMLPQWSWLRFTQKDKVYADGWAKGYGAPGNNLYVNRGIGMSIVPIRIFCLPEITLFTLES